MLKNGCKGKRGPGRPRKEAVSGNQGREVSGTKPDDSGQMRCVESSPSTERDGPLGHLEKKIRSTSQIDRHTGEATQKRAYGKRKAREKVDDDHLGGNYEEKEDEEEGKLRKKRRREKKKKKEFKSREYIEEKVEVEKRENEEDDEKNEEKERKEGNDHLCTVGQINRESRCKY